MVNLNTGLYKKSKLLFIIWGVADLTVPRKFLNKLVTFKEEEFQVAEVSVA